MTYHSDRLLGGYALIFIGVLVWSWIDAADRVVWWLEASPAIAAFLFCAVCWRIFPLTVMTYSLLFLHSLLLLVGAHYTYAEVPLFNDLRDAFDLSRNHFDGVGHFAQGFVPALVIREFLKRTSPLQGGFWFYGRIILSTLGISAAYELLEYWGAITLEQEADAFLAMQGDQWDTQKDMLLALIGAVTSMLCLSRWHDQQMVKKP